MGYDPWAYLEDSMAKQVDWATAPIVCGGIYNKDTGRVLADGTPIVTWGVMGPAEMGRDGKMQGYMTGFDTPPFMYTEGTEQFAGWNLVARPSMLKKPIMSEPRKDKVAELRQAVKDLEMAILAGSTVGG